jgi:acyl transferase domain-containing protein
MERGKKRTRTPIRAADAVAFAQNEIERVLREYGPFFTLADAARRTAMPLPTLSDAVRNGRVQSLRVFGKSFVRLKDVEAHQKVQQRLARKSLSQAILEVAGNSDLDVPEDLARNFRHYLYGHDKKV